MSAIPERFDRLHCNECAQVTKHKIRGACRQTGDPDDGPSWRIVFEILECLGCDDVTFRRTFACPEIDDLEEVRCYPPRASRKLPIWLDAVDDTEIQDLFREVYAALHADSRRLATMGCRAILDRALQNQVGDAGTFQNMLDELDRQRLVSRPDLETLRAVFDAGSAAAHRGHSPSIEDLDIVVSTVEHVVRAQLLHADADGLRKRTPQRANKKPKPQ